MPQQFWHVKEASGLRSVDVDKAARQHHGRDDALGYRFLFSNR